MLNFQKQHLESFKCVHCGAGIDMCNLHLMPGDITIKRAEIVTRSSQQRFKVSEEAYALLFGEFRDSNLSQKIIRVSCHSCGKLFCELSQKNSAWIRGVLETNSIKFCRV